MMRPIRLGMLTPSSNTVLEPVTTAMLRDLPEISAHFARFRVTEISLSDAALGQFDNAPDRDRDLHGIPAGRDRHHRGPVLDSRHWAYTYNALGTRDYAVVQTGVLLAAAVFVVINALADIAYALIDPRVGVRGGAG